MSTHTLSVLVSNAPGVLARVSGLFSRRGFNIESLAVGPTENPEVSRITLLASVEDETVLEQLVKQLGKLIEVYKIIELPDDAVKRELMLIKVSSTNANRSAIVDTVELFRGKSVDVSPNSLTFEVTGSAEKLDALALMLEPFGIIELVKSGQVSLGRGSKPLAESGRRPLSASH